MPTTTIIVSTAIVAFFAAFSILLEWATRSYK